MPKNYKIDDFLPTNEEINLYNFRNKKFVGYVYLPYILTTDPIVIGDYNGKEQLGKMIKSKYKIIKWDHAEGIDTI